MSALSRSAYLEKFHCGELVVSPIVSTEQLGPSSIDLRMGTVVLLARAGGHSHVDALAYSRHATNPVSHETVEARKQKHERFDVPYHASFLLHPGKLALVPTFEWLSLPSDLQGVVTARSSWAREGLSIATATIVNPGYRGTVTLELANLGEIPIKLYPGLRIAQVAFYTLLAGASGFEPPARGQFDMSFEPSAGNIAKEDDVFLPT